MDAYSEPLKCLLVTWFKVLIIMRRVTKKLLIFLFGVFFTVIYCEFLIYYVVIAQCSWPVIENSQNSDVLKAFILADIHLLGPRKGWKVDKWRRESQMHRAFQVIMSLHRPDVVFILGDLFDEGEWSNEKQFEEYVDRFYKLFAIPEDVSMHIAVGNHDVGFHNYFIGARMKRFTKSMNSSSVQFITLKDNNFVLVNSMAMERDNCNMCIEARRRIDRISEKLKCSEDPSMCLRSSIKKVNYSRPILMQHFPLYRTSDSICIEPELPLRERSKMRLKVDVLSKEATMNLVSKIKPRAVFGGHTHYGCLVNHTDDDFYEYSVPSFSWRNRPNPKYMLVSITPEDFSVQECGLPLETTIALTAVILLFIVTWYSITLRVIKR